MPIELIPRFVLQGTPLPHHLEENSTYSDMIRVIHAQQRTILQINPHMIRITAEQTFVTKNNLQSFALSTTVEEAVKKQFDFVIISSCLNLLAYNKTSEITNSNGTDIICPSYGFTAEID